MVGNVTSVACADGSGDNLHDRSEAVRLDARRVADWGQRGSDMARSAPTDLDRKERLVAKYRAVRARRHHQGDPNEFIDRVADEVFGTDEGFRVLLEYLGEDGDPRVLENEQDPATNGTPPDGR